MSVQAGPQVEDFLYTPPWVSERISSSTTFVVPYDQAAIVARSRKAKRGAILQAATSWQVKALAVRGKDCSKAPYKTPAVLQKPIQVSEAH